MVTGAYKPPNPRVSALYRCVQAHFTEFDAIYPTRYQEQYGFYRPVIATTGTILYHSKMHPVLKRNFEVFSTCNWLAALTVHIPNAGEHLVRYSGWYSNVSRGTRRKAQTEDPSTIEECSEVSNSAAKRTWARRSAELADASSSRCTRWTRWCAPGVVEKCGSSPLG